MTTCRSRLTVSRVRYFRSASDCDSTSAMRLPRRITAWCSSTMPKGSTGISQRALIRLSAAVMVSAVINLPLCCGAWPSPEIQLQSITSCRWQNYPDGKVMPCQKGIDAQTGQANGRLGVILAVFSHRNGVDYGKTHCQSIDGHRGPALAWR